MEQKTIFPSRGSLQQVKEEATASLPITTENELIALLNIQENTIYRLIEEHQDANINQ